MTTHSGKNGIVKVGASPAVVGEVREWTLDATAGTNDNTSMNSVQSNGGWKTNKPSLNEWSGSLTCWWDPADTNGQEALTIGTQIAVELYPDDDSSGAVYYSGTATVTAINRSGKLEGEVEASINFMGTGALTQATVS